MSLDHVQLLSCIQDPELKRKTFNIITKHYKELFMDDDLHPVVWEGEVLRFRADPLIKGLANSRALDISNVPIARYKGFITAEMERKIAKSLGYSVSDYF